MKTLMSYLREQFPEVFAPKIMTKWGPVTESARHQAAINMRLDPIKKAQVEALLVLEAGGDVARGLLEAQRRYPEAYEDD
jgi:hypothetical protein